MDYATFLKSVGNGAGLEDKRQAERATISTLTMLGTHLTEGQIENFTAQLPEPLKQEVAESVPQTRRSFSLDQFLSEVQDASGASDRKEAERITRAVMGTLEEAITGGEVQDLFSQLPTEFGDLVAPKSV